MKRIVLALGLLALAAWVLWRLNQPAHAPQSMPSLPAWDVAAVNTIEIRPRGQEAIVLHKRQGGWIVHADKEDTPAEATAVTKLLEDLHNMQPVRLVTSKRKHYRDLGVDAEADRVRLLRDGSILLAVHIGKPASDLVSTYVRLVDQAAVLAVDKSLTWQIKRNPKAWRAVSTEAVAAKGEGP